MTGRPPADSSTFTRTWRSPALWIAAIYILLGALWIAFSDAVVRALPISPEWGRQIETLKGLGYVVVTGVALYLVIDSALRTRLRINRDLEDARRRFELAIEGTDDGIWDWDVLTGQIFWSARLEELLGFGPHEIQPDIVTWEERLHPADRERTKAILAAHLEKGEPYDADYRLRLKDGTYRWFRARGKAIRDASGKPVRMAGSLADIHERVVAQERLAESEERYRQTFHTNQAVKLVIDAETGQIVDVNDAACRFYGYARERLLSMGIFDINTAAREEVLARMEEAKRGSIQFEFKHRLASGEQRDVEVYTGPFELGGRRVFYSIVHDVTERSRARRALAESEKRYRQIVETAREGIWVANTSWHTTFVNATMAEMLGYAPEEMLGRHLFDFMDDEARVECERNMQRREAGIEEQHDFRLRRKDGAPLWVLMSTNSITDDQGRFSGALAMVTDITARRNAEEKAHAAGEMFRSTFEHAAVGMSNVTLEGRWLLVNDRMCEILGRDRATLMRMTFSQVTHPDDIAENMRLLEASVNGAGDTYAMEKRYLRPDGTIVWGHVTASLVRDRDGRPLHFISVVQDISDRKRAETELRESRRVLEQAQAVGRIGSWTWEPRKDGPLVWSAEVFRIFGVEPSKFGGDVDAFDALVHPEDRDAVDRASREALSGGGEYRIEHRIVRPDGTVRWVHEQAEIERDAQGRPLRMIGVVQDITERKVQEHARERSESTTRALLQAIPDMMFRMNRAGEYLDFHAPDKSRLLAPPEKFLGHNVREVLPPERAQQCVQALDTLFQTGLPQTYEYEFRRRDGSTAWWECRIVLSSPDEALLLLRDVTERHNAERRLRESEQRLRLMVENTPLAVISWNPDFTVAGWNPGAEHVFGYSSEQALGRHASFIVPENARRYVDDAWRNLLANKGGFRASNQNLRKDGELIFCEWYNTPLVDPSGKVLGVASLVEDVTDRRLAQQRQDLMMAELDHRVKNNLAAVISLAEQTGRSSAGYTEFLDTFMGRLRAMARMHSVLAGSRWQGADLRTLVTQTLEAFGSGSAGRVAVDGPEVLLSPRAAQAIAMALNELATNAVKYGALSIQSGSVRVSWQVHPIDDGRRRLLLRWAERDGPAVKLPSRRGFGTELIEGAVAYELKGTAKLQFHPDGVVCDFDLVLVGEVDSTAASHAAPTDTSAFTLDPH